MSLDFWPYTHATSIFVNKWRGNARPELRLSHHEGVPIFPRVEITCTEQKKKKLENQHLLISPTFSTKMSKLMEVTRDSLLWTTHPRSKIKRSRGLKDVSDTDCPTLSLLFSFLILSTMNIWVWIPQRVLEWYSGHHRMFSSIPSSNHFMAIAPVAPVVTTKNVSKHCKCPLLGRGVGWKSLPV